ncbi:MAG: DUF5043 domain-containing protein [Dysgonomonas sp.]
MKTILFSIILLLGAIDTSAQTYYYNNTKTFNENGYTYQCDVNTGSKEVILYNKSNQLTYVNMVNKTTGEAYFIPTPDGPYTFTEESWVDPKYTSIINNAFTAAEKQRLKGYKLSTTLRISPATGKVMEVKFTFTSNDPYATIPVSVYRNIEVQLKDQIWFTPTAEASKYNYLHYHWMQEVK